MRPAKWFLAALMLMSALLVQLVVVNRLPLPVGVPDLLLLVIAIVALIEGPLPGALLGFASGLFADFASEHVIGRLALILCVLGYLVGQLTEEAERSLIVPLATVAGASALGVVLYVGTGLVVGDPRVHAAPLGPVIGSSVLYNLILTPFCYPLIRGLFARLDPQLKL